MSIYPSWESIPSEARRSWVTIAEAFLACDDTDWLIKHLMMRVAELERKNAVLTSVAMRGAPDYMIVDETT